MFVVTAIMALCSCATIFTPSVYPVTIKTNPSGAHIRIENRMFGVVYEGASPASVRLEAAAGYMRKEEYKITISKDGYDPVITHITPKLDGWYIGNLLIGGWIGMLIVDPASGAMYKIAKDDRQINVDLNPNEMRLQVYDINNLPEYIDKATLVSIK